MMTTAVAMAMALVNPPAFVAMAVAMAMLAVAYMGTCRNCSSNHDTSDKAGGGSAMVMTISAIMGVCIDK